MGKQEAFNELWIKYDYCMMGYSYESLYKNMSKKEVIERLKKEKQDGLHKIVKGDK